MARFSSALDIVQMSDPAVPQAGRQSLYFKSDGTLYTKKPDGSVVAVGGAKYAVTVGNASATSFTIPHNLGTSDVHVLVYGPSSGYTVSSVVIDTENQATVTFATAPPLNSVRVVVTS